MRGLFFRNGALDQRPQSRHHWQILWLISEASLHGSDASTQVSQLTFVVHLFPPLLSAEKTSLFNANAYIWIMSSGHNEFLSLRRGNLEMCSFFSNEMLAHSRYANVHKEAGHSWCQLSNGSARLRPSPVCSSMALISPKPPLPQPRISLLFVLPCWRTNIFGTSVSFIWARAGD